MRDQISEEIKNKKNKMQYDCVVPGSGGKERHLHTYIEVQIF